MISSLWPESECSELNNSGGISMSVSVMLGASKIIFLTKYFYVSRIHQPATTFPPRACSRWTNPPPPPRHWQRSGGTPPPWSEKNNFTPRCWLFGIKLKTSSHLLFRRLLLADTGHVRCLLLQDFQSLLSAAGELRPAAGRAGSGAGDHASRQGSIKCSRSKSC